ncbi:MAG TPA: lysozyme inhibitor LprI family protein [Allosphingosinicella sp.]|jgi:uncharacterized protein YecT (DUF1311 family)
MKQRAWAVAIAAVLLVAAAEPAWDWADATDEIASGPEYERSKAICRSVRGREPPVADAPDASTAAALKGCDSEALYYGIGVTADPVRARQCAFLEAAGRTPDQSIDSPFGGRAMLMTIYANGRGAVRDLDVATHLACGIEGAVAEVHGRVLHLQEMKAAGTGAEEFHFCDDVTSGLAGGWCAGHSARIAKAAREAELAGLIAAWPERSKLALLSLRAAQSVYSDASADGEVDMSGTLRSAFWIERQEMLDRDMLATLRLLTQGQVSGSRGDYAAADKALNAAYRARLAEVRAAQWGTVKPEGVRAAQRAWLRYRDAFLAFAAVQYPQMSRDGLAAMLTRQRTRLLLGEEE